MNSQERQKMVMSMQKYAYKIARRYTTPRVEFDDLYQSAMEGVCSAVNSFDSTRGEFFNHASIVALTFVRRFFVKNHFIIPLKYQDSSIVSELYEKFGVNVTSFALKELCDETGKDFNKLLPLLDLLHPEKADLEYNVSYSQNFDICAIITTIDKLKSKKGKKVMHSYLQHGSMTEVGRDLGIDRRLAIWHYNKSVDKLKELLS